MAIIVAAAAGVAVPSGSTAGQGPVGTTGSRGAPLHGTFRSRTDLVALQVAVVDKDGRPVPDLRREDFAVFEEGVPQAVTLFATSSAPLDVMLLLDASGSMQERMASARAAAVELLHTLRRGDRAALILFNDHVRMAQALTEDRGLVEAAILKATPSGGTALYESLYIALRQLALARPPDGEIRRQALVILSDGADTTSRNVNQQDVLDVARRSAVTIFTIVPASEVELEPYERVTRDAPGAEFNLRTLARETGGRAFTPARAEDLSGAYRQIADELGQQYWLAYLAPTSTGGFRRVSVQVVSQPQLRARTRSGYFAATPRRSDLRPPTAAALP